MIDLEKDLYSILALGKDPYEYYKVYNEIVDNALPRGLDKLKFSEYMEIHHVLPRTIGGFKDSKSISNALNHSRECYGYNWMFKDNFKQKYPKELEEYEKRIKYNDNARES